MEGPPVRSTGISAPIIRELWRNYMNRSLAEGMAFALGLKSRNHVLRIPHPPARAFLALSSRVFRAGLSLGATSQIRARCARRLRSPRRSQRVLDAHRLGFRTSNEVLYAFRDPPPSYATFARVV